MNTSFRTIGPCCRFAILPVTIPVYVCVRSICLKGWSERGWPTVVWRSLRRSWRTSTRWRRTAGRRWWRPSSGISDSKQANRRCIKSSFVPSYSSLHLTALMGGVYFSIFCMCRHNVFIWLWQVLYYTIPSILKIILYLILFNFNFKCVTTTFAGYTTRHCKKWSRLIGNFWRRGCLAM